MEHVLEKSQESSDQLGFWLRQEGFRSVRWVLTCHWNRGETCVFLKCFISSIDLTGILSRAYLWPVCTVSSEISLIFTSTSQMKKFSLSFNSVSSGSCIFGSFCSERLEDGTTRASFCQSLLDKIILPGDHFPRHRGYERGECSCGRCVLRQGSLAPLVLTTEVLHTVHSEAGDKFQSRKHWFHHCHVVEIVKRHNQSAESQIL